MDGGPPRSFLAFLAFLAFLRSTMHALALSMLPTLALRWTEAEGHAGHMGEPHLELLLVFLLLLAIWGVFRISSRPPSQQDD